MAIVDSENLLKRFGRYLKLERGLSANTVEGYTGDVEKLVDFIQAEELDWSRVTGDDLHRFVCTLQDLGIGARSQARIISGIKSFFGFLKVEKVIDDRRFNTYGVPRNKTKSSKKASDKKETVPNANYLWIGLFATSLNDTGKAALVMANSASDAGGSEFEIRKKMITDGIISQMVTLPSNMFSTVTLPATLWFFDKQKKNRDEILFIDARNIFTQVDRAHRKFSEEQIKNLGIITRLYEGDSDAFWALVEEYKQAGKQEQIDWLLERWPEGKYQDVIGLCKVAKLEGEDGIIDQDYSLNPGRYVGVVIEDDGMTEEEFAKVMKLNFSELKNLNNKAKTFIDEIEGNIKILFGDK